MNSKEYRCRSALNEAAMKAHPDFKQTPNHAWRWTGNGAMPSDTAMIDWFQTTHSTEARQIEQEIEGSSP